jgi:transcriptional regulator with XRE-family HTH domain
MGDARIDLTRSRFGPEVGRRVREARTLIGWSQRELAAKARVSQAAIWRLETAQPGPVDLAVVERLLAALGLRATVSIEDRHLDDRRRQADGVHAVLNGFGARRVGRCGWATETEALIGGPVPRGWIDLLAFRGADRALLVDETKSDIPDMGALQRSLAFYEREARGVASEFGWRPLTVTVLVLGLDSEVMARRLADNRLLVAEAFPGDVSAMAAWLTDPAAPRPRGWTLALADPASRGATWLRPTMLGTRRRPPAYRDYADAAARLLGR